MDDRLSADAQSWWWYLVEQHLDPMTAIVADLGDRLVNETPALPGANSPYQIVFHCCGMLEWWTREAVLGTPVGRDRAAEFAAVGSVASLRMRIEQVRDQLRNDLPLLDAVDVPRGDIRAEDRDTPLGATAHGVLLHVLEELAQHHGHLELTRDLVRAVPTD